MSLTKEIALFRNYFCLLEFFMMNIVKLVVDGAPYEEIDATSCRLLSN